jgi:hypothetical protein
VQFRVEPEATATSAPLPGPDTAAVVPGVAGPPCGGAAAAAGGAPVSDWVELSDVLDDEGALLMLEVAGGLDDVTTEVPTPGKGAPWAPVDGAVHGKTRPRWLSIGEIDHRASADVAAWVARESDGWDGVSLRVGTSFESFEEWPDGRGRRCADGFGAGLLGAPAWRRGADIPAASATALSRPNIR